jgi:hypothetical protein
VEKAYSTNNEDFNYSEVDAVFQALSSEGRLFEGAVYYEADVVAVRLADYLESRRILEFAAESIYDELGEVAESAFQPTQEGHDELNALTAAWCEKHFAGERYWRCRGRSRELKVTAGDVAEYG